MGLCTPHFDRPCDPAPVPSLVGLENSCSSSHSPVPISSLIPCPPQMPRGAPSPGPHVTEHAGILASVPPRAHLSSVQCILSAVGCLDCCVEKDSGAGSDILLSDVLACQEGGSGRSWTDLCQRRAALRCSHLLEPQAPPGASEARFLGPLPELLIREAWGARSAHFSPALRVVSPAGPRLRDTQSRLQPQHSLGPC